MALLDLLPAIMITCLVAGILYYYYLDSRKRKEALRRLSMQIGFTFKDSYDKSLPDCKLFSQGRNAKAYNVMEGSRGWIPWKIFTYSYTVGNGRSSHSNKQTVFLVTLKDRKMPRFVVGPENYWHRFAQFFGMRDIDFKNYPKFSKMYLLRGDKEEEVRKLFDSSRIRHFEHYPTDLTVEGSGKHLLVYKLKKRYRANEIPEMMDKVQRIVDVFK